MMDLHQPGFWAAVGEIILINILLSGDNAVVIALACRRLPRTQRIWGMVIGAGVASILLIAFTGVVAALVSLPYLKMAGAVALLWVAVRLLADEDGDDDEVHAPDSLWRAVRIVVIADIVMSLDNTIAVAVTAKGNYLLLGLGLAVSIPIVIGGSAAIMWVLRKLPFLVWVGAMLLGWIAGDIFIDDPVLAPLIGQEAVERLNYPAALLGATFVLVTSLMLRRRRRALAGKTDAPSP